MTHKQHYSVYIASCDAEGGIYRYEMDDRGRLTYATRKVLDRPMYLAIENSKLYAILRQPFDNNESGLITYDINADGDLINSSELISTKGEVACHLAVDRGTVYCVNYITGNVIKMPDKIVKHKGKSIHKTRQTAPHTHYVCITPDGKYVLVVDLGLDKIITYTKNMEMLYDASVPQGHGSRHLVFSKDGKTIFCANELESTVSVFDYDNGKLQLRETYSTLPKDYSGISTVAAIRISNDGKYLYVSNRGHDSITCFQLENESLVLKSITPCGGKSPRDFNIIGHYLLCANENSNNVTIFKVDRYRLTKTDSEIKMKCPLCIISQ